MAKKVPYIHATAHHIKTEPLAGDEMTTYDPSNLVLLMRLLNAEAGGTDYEK